MVGKEIQNKARKWFELLGCPVLAVRNKKPLIDSWKPYETVPMSNGGFEDQPWSEADCYALVMCQPMKNGYYLTLLDLDNHDSEFWHNEDFKNFNTFLEKTPHGFHALLFSKKKPIHNEDFKELELKTYLCFMYDNPLNSEEIKVVDDVVPYFRDCADRFNLKPKNGITATKGTELFSLEKLLSTPVPKGDRNRLAIFIGSKLRGQNKTKEEVEIILTDWNKNNIPPFTPTELHEKVKDVFRPEEPYYYHKEEVLLTPEICREATLEEVLEILSKTIKFDNKIKAIVFLSLLTAFTEHEQVNDIIEGESSVGKTHTVKEILYFFPKDSWIQKHGVTPTAFFYDDNRFLVDKNTLKPFVLVKPDKDSSEEEKEAYRLAKKNAVMLQDFERKIIWLPDMPDVKVLEKIRSILSHDDKVCNYTSTTGTKFGFNAKTVLLKGFGVFIICCCEPYLNEQETSRAFQLNPEWSKEKELACLELINRRESGVDFNQSLESDAKRLWLKDRIEAIKNAKINEIFISEELFQRLNQWFLEKRKTSTPKSSREYNRLRSLAKAWCLFNLWNRKQDDKHNLYCAEQDIEVAEKVYETIVESSVFNLSPEEYSFFKHLEENFSTLDDGFSVSQAHQVFYVKNGRPCSDKRLRNMLESFCREGLLRKEKRGQTYYYYIQIPKKEEAPTKEQISGWLNE